MWLFSSFQSKCSQILSAKKLKVTFQFCSHFVRSFLDIGHRILKLLFHLWEWYCFNKTLLLAKFLLFSIKLFLSGIEFTIFSSKSVQIKKLMVIKFSSCSILEKYAFSSKKLLTFVSLWCGEDGTVLPFNLLDTALDSIDVVADLLHLCQCDVWRWVLYLLSVRKGKWMDFELPLSWIILVLSNS